MQALRCACSGTRDSNSAEKLTFVHQQGSVLVLLIPELRCASMAQRLGCPHKGQAQASTGMTEFVDIFASVAMQTRHN